MSIHNSLYQSIYRTITIKFIVVILVLFVGNNTKGQVAFEWANTLGSSGITITALVTDQLGNVYTTGQFGGTVDFDPKGGVHNITAGGNIDYFLLKLDPLGNFVWVKTMTSSNNRVIGKKLCIAADNSVLIFGEFSGLVDFDPNAGIQTVAAVTGDLFIQNIAADGNLIWVKTFVSFSTSFGPTARDLSLDKQGNIYSTGSFYDSVDVDPGPSVSKIYSNKYADVFILKLDAQGDFIWAKTLGGTRDDGGVSVGTDTLGNVYTMGYFRDTVDFNPDTTIFNLAASTIWDETFILKLDPQGAFVWAQSCVSYSCRDTKIDPSGNIYNIGNFQVTVDFDPDSSSTHYLTSNGSGDVFVQKLDAQGHFIWAKSFGGLGWDFPRALTLDSANNIYSTGHFDYLADVDPDTSAAHYISSNGQWDAYIQKLDAQGNFMWARNIGGLTNDIGICIAVNRSNIYTSGEFEDIGNFDTENGFSFMGSLNSTDTYIHKLNEQGITGRVYQDFNASCLQDSLDVNLANRSLLINPGNIITTTNSNGIWRVDNLPLGNYTITVDTTGNWLPTCPITQNFTVSNNDGIIYAANFGFVSTNPCPEPNVSIHAPFLRPGFSNQSVYIQVSNLHTGTASLDSLDIIIELDTLLTVQSMSVPYVSLGNNQFKIGLDTLLPGGNSNAVISCLLSPNAILGQTLCMSAQIVPIDACVLDTIPNPYPPGTINPCTLPWDNSSLSIVSHCINDSIHFIIRNNGVYGAGDMTCYAPVRLYIDGQYFLGDSIQLAGEDSVEYIFSGDGRTWRMEVSQHPLHPGNSQPSTTIELCGNTSNWTSNLVTILPQDDADPTIDIYCGLVTGSFDPNDKTGYPLGVTSAHHILPNQALEYLIRFQNTGTDTAFTVVIRDTLSTDLDIFSVQTLNSSHNHSFRMYGPRILEWTFYNIMLADSTTNEPASHGFIKFKVNPLPNLSLGTVIENTAFIYFDFNLPIITNTTQHQLAVPQNVNWDGQQTLNFTGCSDVVYNNISYDQPGTYWQRITNSGLDSLYTLNIAILETTSSIAENACHAYTAADNQVYTSSGVYTAIIPNAAGCDSIITINLTIKDSSFATINASSCTTYTAADNQVYTSSGVYTAIIPNAAGCDSIITINLTIKDSSFATINASSCNNYTAADNQVYTSSGQYTATIPNAAGCDSIITINLTIYQIPSVLLYDTTCSVYYVAPDGQWLFATGQYTAVIPSYLGCDSTIIVNVVFNQSSSSVLNESACNIYTAPDGQLYYSSGQYFATVLNASNCDSTITINLIIDNLADSSVIQNGFTLTANAAGFSYQWLDCNFGNAPISGATNQSYTAISNGNYAVQITNGTCTLTSDCINVTGVGNNSINDNLQSIHLYPNPTTGFLYISKKDHYEINIDLIDNLGRVLLSKIAQKQLIKMNLNPLPSGIYYLTINNRQQTTTRKIVKE